MYETRSDGISQEWTMFPDRIRFTVDKEWINGVVLRSIWPLTSANWKRIPQLPCTLCTCTMTLRENREKYRFCSDDIGNKNKKKKKEKIRSQVCPRGRHAKNMTEKIATTHCLCRTGKLPRCRVFEKTVPYKIVIARNSYAPSLPSNFIRRFNGRNI